jgi:hypothetical protein
VRLATPDMPVILVPISTHMDLVDGALVGLLLMAEGNVTALGPVGGATVGPVVPVAGVRRVQGEGQADRVHQPGDPPGTGDTELLIILLGFNILLRKINNVFLAWFK